MADPEDAWSSRALCADENPELWFEEGASHRPVRHDPYTFARPICNRCPLRSPCLEFALDFEKTLTTTIGRHGMYGGKTPVERSRIARKREQVAS